MGAARFELNAKVRLDGRTHVLTRLVAAITWQLEDTRTKRITGITIPELQTLYLIGALIFEPPAGRPAVATRFQTGVSPTKSTGGPNGNRPL
ncbi:hypothetical protein [Roseateles sp. P5_E11]